MRRKLKLSPRLAFLPDRKGVFEGDESDAGNISDLGGALQQKYDYIIVGAGSAGCVLANRLSEDRALSVLLIESGPADSSPLITMPRGIGKLLAAGNPHVWDYQAVPRPGLEPELWLKGRTLGGSSSINGTVYVRGAPADYDHWEAL